MENNAGESPRYTAHGRSHSPTRERILRTLEDGAATTSEIVAATGLHENTVRGHLEALLEDGYLDRRRITPSGRGRPAWRWIAVAPSNPTEPYAELAHALADAMASPETDPVVAARSAGVRWGERLAGTFDREPPPSNTGRGTATGAGAARNETPPRDRAWEQVLAAMTRQGFAPDDRLDDDGTALLHRCPLLAAVRGNERIVCTVHEGMIEGIVRRWGLRASLTPFAEPRACAVQLLGARPS